MAACRLLLPFLLLVKLSSALNVEVIKPQKTFTTEVAVLVVPGAEIKGELYRPLGEAIQAACPLQLWVALLEGWPLDTPDPVLMDTAVDMAIEALHQQGMKSDNIFLAGHSLGGVFVGTFGQSHPDKLKGVLLFASYLTRGHLLKDYPLPVLTISGDLDGLTRITRIVDTFEELQADVTSDHSAIYRTPVIVMEGSNHGQFASGDMPPNVKEHDFIPDLTEDAAHKLIAGHVSDALVATMVTSGSLATDAKTSLEKAFNTTKKKLKIFSHFKAFDSDKHISNASLAAEVYIMDDAYDPSLTINNEVVSEADLLIYEPYVNASALEVHTYTAVRWPFNPEDVSLNPQTPEELMAKMKSKNATKKLFPSKKTDNTTRTCQYINKIVYYAVGLSVPSIMIGRRVLRGGEFYTNDDIMSADASEWYSSHLDLKYNDGDLTATSYAYVTPTDLPVSTFAGMHYCKLISFFRMLEWYALDSLKRN